MDTLMDRYRALEHFVSVNKNTIFSSLAALLMIVGGAGWYQSNKQQKAYQTHTQLLELTALKSSPIQTEEGEGFTSEKQKWERILAVAEEASTYSPLFKASEAEALVNLDRLDEARIKMKEAVASLPTSKLSDLYTVTLALMEIDVGNTDDGLRRLSKIAENDASESQELALFRLGEYSWTQGNFDEARTQWEHLIFQHERSTPNVIDKSEASHWVNEAQEKLALMSER